MKSVQSSLTHTHTYTHREKGKGTWADSLSSSIGVSPSRCLVHCRDQVRVDPRADNHFHHGKVLQIVVSLEKGIAGEELDEDAADAPDVARERPAQTKNDFGSPVVPGRNDRRMIFVLECGGPEVDQSNFSVEQDFTLVRLTVDRG